MPILRSSVETWWRDFAPITLLGLLLLTGTELILQLTGAATSESESTLTLVITVRATAFALFVAAVSAGTLLRLSGLTKQPGPYMRVALKVAQPGLWTALVIAVGLFCLLIGEFFLRMLIGEASSLVVVFAILFMIAIWLPAIPLSIEERLPPLNALRRASGLTKHYRTRLLGLVLLIGIILVPPTIFVFAIVFGTATVMGADGAPDTLPALALNRPGFWIMELSNLMFSGLIAVVPPTVYLALKGGRNA